MENSANLLRLSHCKKSLVLFVYKRPMFRSFLKAIYRVRCFCSRQQAVEAVLVKGKSLNFSTFKPNKYNTRHNCHKSICTCLP